VGSLPPPKLGAKLVSDKRNHNNIKRRLNESYLDYAATDGSQWRSGQKRKKKGSSSPKRGADLDRG
jgi:hypothetical protein